jgi:GNAT superfamily N-acetyltransferase
MTLTDAMAVRWATVDDADAIAEVHIASWRAAYQGLIPDEVLDGLRLDRRAAQWRIWLAEGGERAFTLVAERGGAIQGFCTLAMPSQDAEEADEVAEIPALYLRPESRRGGVGTSLVGAALDEMRSRGFREAILWMLEGNDPAAAFYERGGWQRDGGSRGSQYLPEMEELVEVRFRRPL